MFREEFPRDFLWGAGSSSHQVEGNTNNGWTEWEKENASRLAGEAKEKYEQWQQEKFPEMFDPSNYISGNACDEYHRYEEDFDLAKEGAQNAHRFSLEWARIEPEEGRFDEREIGHYKKVISALRQRGIEPFVTLWHWTEPLWFAKAGGWESGKSVDYFSRYVEKVVGSLGGGVRFWIVINEPNVALGFGYLRGTQPPAKQSVFSFLRAYFHLLAAYKKSYHLIHRMSSNAQVGFANSFVRYETILPEPLGGITLCVARYFSRYFFNHTQGCNDFIGCNYYSRDFIFSGKPAVSSQKLTDLGWEIYPEGIYRVLKEVKKHNLPIYITENGLADASDSKRGKFIEDHLTWVLKAMKEGVDVKGYFHWSLLDNFEFPELRGFWPRFGLIEVDFKTLERKPRKSYYAYRAIISTRGKSLKMV